MGKLCCRVLSSVFLGVFVAPPMSLLWFAVPMLRDFPVGDDSPHALGIPVGLCIGAWIALKLNTKFDWGKSTAWVGTFLLTISIVATAALYVKTTNTPGWEGFGWLFATIISAHFIVAFLGLTFAGFFAHLGKRQ